MSIHLNKKKQELIENIIDKFLLNALTRLEYLKKIVPKQFTNIYFYIYTHFLHFFLFF